MGSIYTGVGLISGLDIQNLVDQLIAIDARPRDLLLARIGDINAQRTAYLDVTARISALQSRISSLTSRSFFEATTGSSSNPDVLGVVTSAGAQQGAYKFIVRSLASTHQLVSQGFRARDSVLPEGSLTIESGAARVNSSTTLDELNGHTGVQRGPFKLKDGNNNEATIYLNDALTIGDVIDKINDAGLNIQAALRGEGIVLTETNGGAIRVREADGGHTAADLGFATGNTTGTGELVGSDVIYLADTTPIAALNDGNGVRTSVGGDFQISGASTGGFFDVDLSDILKTATRLERLNHGQGVNLGTVRVTTRDGVTTDVDLSESKTIGDVQTALDDAVAGITVVVTGQGLVITDSTMDDADDDAIALKIEDLSGSAARDLGIASSSDTGKIKGNDVLYMETLADVIAAINYAYTDESNQNNGTVVASIGADGQGLVITDNGTGTGRLNLNVPDDWASSALRDLGFEPGDYGGLGGGLKAAGRRVIGGLDTVLLDTLNGGSGVAGGVIQIDVDGEFATVDLRNAETLRDVIEAINKQSQTLGLGLEAGYDATGTRLQVEHESGAPIAITDVSGDFAQTLGLTQTGPRIQSNNLQRRYISETTRLEDLNAGRGATLGKLKFTSSTGQVSYVDLAQSGAETLQDVIDQINKKAVGLTARINQTGDGLLISDTAGGELDLRIEDEGGTIARDLNILGQAEDGQIDGSFEFTLDVEPGDTLDSLVSRINSDVTLASASVFSDGTGTAPFRLNISARATGAVGELIIDGSDMDLDFTTLSQARDASVLLGDDPHGGVLITNSSNILTDVVDGVTITLNAVDDDPVTITIDHDLNTLVSTVSGLVSDFNTAMNRMEELSSYDLETEQRGILLGDNALRATESRLYRLFSGTFTDAPGTIARLSELGIKLGSGARLSFDEQTFRDAYEDNSEEVIQFFTTEETGWAHVAKERLEEITGTNGLFERRENTLESQKELLNGRIDQLNELLDRKRERLMREFQAMEAALAGLQAQQSALSSLATLASSTSLFQSSSSSQ